MCAVGKMVEPTPSLNLRSLCHSTRNVHLHRVMAFGLTQPRPGPHYLTRSCISKCHHMIESRSWRISSTQRANSSFCRFRRFSQIARGTGQRNKFPTSARMPSIGARAPTLWSSYVAEMCRIRRVTNRRSESETSPTGVRSARMASANSGLSSNSFQISRWCWVREEDSRPARSW